jgi:hypothetical protein
MHSTFWLEVRRIMHCHTHGGPILVLAVTMFAVETLKKVIRSPQSDTFWKLTVVFVAEA